MGMVMDESSGRRKLGGELGTGEVVGGKRKLSEVDGRSEQDAKATEYTRPMKKLRVETNLEVTYDSTGTPVFINFAKSAPASRQQHIAPTSPPPALPTPKNTPAAHKTDIPTQPCNQRQQRPKPGITKNGGFSLLHAFCQDNSLLLQFVSYLPVPSLIALYSISKPFHYHFNKHHTAFILANMRTWAPGSDKVFPWRCYKSLCVKDPNRVQKLRLQGREAEVKRKWDDLRDAPSLKWLQMVVWREGVCRDMLVVLRTQALLCPPGTLQAVKKMWFLMDLPLNAHRIALIHSKTYFPDEAIERFMMFLFKVDMLFTDPIQPAYPINHPNQRYYPQKHNGKSFCGVTLRKLLLYERHMTSLWRVIRGWSPDPKDPQRPLTRLDVLQLWVRNVYRHPEGTPEEVKRMDIMDVPWYEVGMGNCERTGVAFHTTNVPTATAPNDSTPAQDGIAANTQPAAQRQIAITHPSILSANLTSLQQAQLHAQKTTAPQNKAPSQQYQPDLIVLPNPKSREPLLRPDELVIRESVRRGMRTHAKWAQWMMWGFTDAVGIDLPVLSEEDILRGLNGLPDKTSKRDEGGTDEGSLEEANGVDGHEGCEEMILTGTKGGEVADADQEAQSDSKG